MVVDPSSASPQLPGVTYYGVEATHAQLCKFENPSSPGFRALSTDLRQWVLEAPDFIAVRWDVEEHDKAARMQYEVQERISGWVWPF